MFLQLLSVLLEANLIWLKRNLFKRIGYPTKKKYLTIQNISNPSPPQRNITKYSVMTEVFIMSYFRWISSFWGKRKFNLEYVTKKFSRIKECLEIWRFFIVDLYYCYLYISWAFLRNESIQIVSYFFGDFGFLAVSSFLSYRLKVRYSYTWI